MNLRPFITLAALSAFQVISQAAVPIPITGKPVPELAAIDAAVTSFMRDNGIHGGALAVMKDGRLVLTAMVGVIGH